MPGLDDVIKAYDVRGTYPDQLDESLAHDVGAALVRVIGIAAGLWAILSHPSVAPHIRDGWLVLSVAGTVIAWVTGVVFVASRQRVPVYDTEYEPPADS